MAVRLSTCRVFSIAKKSRVGLKTSCGRTKRLRFASHQFSAKSEKPILIRKARWQNPLRILYSIHTAKWIGGLFRLLGGYSMARGSKRFSGKLAKNSRKNQA